MQRCDDCGSPAETARVSLHAVTGMIIAWQHRSVSGNLCRSCIRRHYWDHTLGTLIGGWWSVPSIVFAPLCIIGNTVCYLQSFTLARSEGNPKLPLPPFEPGARRWDRPDDGLASFDGEIIRRLRDGERVAAIARDVAARAGTTDGLVMRHIDRARLQRAAASRDETAGQS